MENRQACFTCTTPYQVIGAMSICMNNKIDADIYVFGMFNGYKDLCVNIKETGIFQNVYDVDCKDFRFTKKGKAFRQIVFYKQTLKAFLDPNVSYNLCYTSSRAHIKTLMFHELLNRNPKMRFVIYEDGLGTYRPDTSQIRTSSRRKRMERLFGWKLFTADNTQIIAYEPSLVSVQSSVSTLPVGAMPRIDWKGAQGEIVRSVFGVSHRDALKERVIFFDDLRYGDKETDKKLDQCCEIAKRYFGNRMIYKPHPRSAYNTKCDISFVPFTGTPMEVIYAIMDDIEDLVIISCTSTAAFTPKLLFGKEPRQIDIHKIACNDKHGKDLDNVLGVLKNMYIDKSKIMIPETITEYEAMIKEVAFDLKQSN